VTQIGLILLPDLLGRAETPVTSYDTFFIAYLEAGDLDFEMEGRISGGESKYPGAKLQAARGLIYFQLPMRINTVDIFSDIDEMKRILAAKVRDYSRDLCSAKNSDNEGSNAPGD
jgi:hypothetical protein